MKELVSKFSANIPKAAKSMAKMVGNDDFHPNMKFVVLNPTDGYIAASDMRKMQLMEATFEGSGKSVGIEPKQFAEMAGNEISVNVYKEVIEVEKSVTRNSWRGYITTLEKVKETHFDVVAACGGKEYITHYADMHFPDFRRVVPRLQDYDSEMKLSESDIKALMKICKLCKNDELIRINIFSGLIEIANNSRTMKFRMAANHKGNDTVLCFDPNLLSDCLKLCNGTIYFKSNSPRPVKFGSDAGHVILMMKCGDNTVDEINTCADTAFMDDAANIARQIADKASEMWREIVACNNKLQPGNYTASDLKSQNNAKCGFYVIPESCGDYDSHIVFSAGNIEVKIKLWDIFNALSKWQSFAKIKPIFSVGNCIETVEDVVSDNSGKAARVKLRELGGGWYVEVPKKAVKYYDSANLYHKINGKFIFVQDRQWSNINSPETWRHFTDMITTDVVIEKILSQTDARWANIARILGLSKAFAV